MLDGFHGIAKDVANEFFTNAEKLKLTMRSGGNSQYEIIFKIDSDTSVGTIVPISMFHRTETVHSEWRNLYTNLKEKYNQKVDEQQAAKDRADIEAYAKRKQDERNNKSE